MNHRSLSFFICSITIFLFSLTLHGQEEETKNYNWEVGTYFLGGWDFPGINGMYLSKKLSNRLDLLAVTSGLNSFVTSIRDAEIIYPGREELEYTTYSLYLSAKWNKAWHNKSIFVTLGPQFSNNRFDYKNNGLNVDIERDEGLLILKSIIGANFVYNDVFSFSVESSIEWLDPYKYITGKEAFFRIDFFTLVRTRAGIRF